MVDRRAIFLAIRRALPLVGSCVQDRATSATAAITTEREWRSSKAKEPC
jgi:hypothetical protein